jgi:hypothetical protein
MTLKVPGFAGPRLPGCNGDQSIGESQDKVNHLAPRPSFEAKVMDVPRDGRSSCRCIIDG